MVITAILAVAATALLGSVLADERPKLELAHLGLVFTMLFWAACLSPLGVWHKVAAAATFLGWTWRWVGWADRQAKAR